MTVMKINVAVCALALLSVPILVSAQESSPAPVLVSPAATPVPLATASAWPRRNPYTPADLTQLKAIGTKLRAENAKQQALMNSARAKLFASVTPAHRRLVAQIVGELAISSNPDATAAAKQIDAVLSAAEKKAVIAAHQSGRAQMDVFRKQSVAQRAQFQAFMTHLMSERKAAGWPVRRPPMAQLSPMAQGPTARLPAMPQGPQAQLPPMAQMNQSAPRLMIHKNWKTRTPDAGWYLIVAAQTGPHLRGMVNNLQRWDFAPGMHGMGGAHPPMGPGPVVPPSH